MMSLHHGKLHGASHYQNNPQSSQSECKHASVPTLPSRKKRQKQRAGKVGGTHQEARTRGRPPHPLLFEAESPAHVTLLEDSSPRRYSWHAICTLYCQNHTTGLPAPHCLLPAIGCPARPANSKPAGMTGACVEPCRQSWES